MDPRIKQWLLWVGDLYQEIIATGQLTDVVLSRRMRTEGRLWGHDARRWVSTMVYALVRSRVRTLWFWAVTDWRKSAPVSPSPPVTPTPSTSEAAPPISHIGPLDFHAAAGLNIIPIRLLARRDVHPSPPAEAVIGWVSRRPGSPLDQLIRALDQWVAPTDPLEALQALSEGGGKSLDFDETSDWITQATRLHDHPPTLNTPAEKVCWDCSIPIWLADRWCKQYGEESLVLGRTFEAPAPVYLRVNTLKTTPEEVERQLRDEQYHVASVDAVPGALQVVHRANLYRSHAFEEGLFEVQDVSSQMVAYALDPQPGERVLDYCAGAGGKTLHLAALMQNKGLLWALDIDSGRLVRLRERAARAGAFNIRRALIPAIAAEELERVWENSTRVSLGHSAWKRTLSPVFLSAIARSRGNQRLVVDDPAAAIETAEVPESMRASLGLDIPPHPSRHETSEQDSTTDASPRRHLRRPYEAPQPSEKELQELEQAIHNMPADFDAVLVDAPCSGTGVCRRRPDFGWRMNPELLNGHMREQAAILRTAAQYVRPGGRLLYATCSILPEENEEQILSFLEDTPQFEPLDMTPSLLRHSLDHRLPEHGAFWLTLLPHRQPGDGFFMALLRRKLE